MTWKPDICLFHGNCMDGFGAAWAIWQRWPDCIFLPAVYDKPLPLEGIDVVDRNILMVDFSAPPAALKNLAMLVATVVVVDHHKSAATASSIFPDFAVTPNAPFPLDKDSSGIWVWFDMLKSGARMAWEFAFPDRELPEMLALIEDRDLWCFQFGDRSRQLHAALRTYPQNFDRWTDLSRRVERLVQEGEAIMCSDSLNVAQLIAEAYWTTFMGHAIPIANAPYFYASDVGNALLKAYPNAPFAASWFRGKEGLVHWSLRSEDSRQDVSLIAKSLGGGGHRNAAGCTTKGRETP